MTKTHSATLWLIFQVQEVVGFVNPGSGSMPTLISHFKSLTKFTTLISFRQENLSL